MMGQLSWRNADHVEADLFVWERGLLLKKNMSCTLYPLALPWRNRLKRLVQIGPRLDFDKDNQAVFPGDDIDLPQGTTKPLL